MEKSTSERDLALHVVQRLREAGFAALWAGGCVRDILLGREPQDFDVATDAHPDQVRSLFGYRRTLAVGQSFGVIIVLGSPRSICVEVATFRKDSVYSDGRHPDSVEFSSPAEDAARRDFTVNGLFYDPVSEQVLDFVGGQSDLSAGLIRAIGNPHDRFAEDKLRIVRAVRFATSLDFDIEPATFAAIRERPHELGVVSAERVTAELKKILLSKNRVKGLKLLHATGLLAQVVPEVDWDSADPAVLQELTAQLAHSQGMQFSIVFAMLMRCIGCDRTAAVACAGEAGRRWRLTNAEINAAEWLLRHESFVLAADQLPWPDVQRALVHDLGPLLVEYGAAICETEVSGRAGVAFCRERLGWPRARLDPPTLLDGDLLKEVGIAPGPIYKRILKTVRDAQLLGEINSSSQAIELAKDLAADQE